MKLSEDTGEGVFLIVIGKIILVLSSINLTAYLVSNYDKVIGAALSFVSFIYVCIKIVKELTKPKKNEGD
jgi:hypothetical protein